MLLISSIWILYWDIKLLLLTLVSSHDLTRRGGEVHISSVTLGIICSNNGMSPVRLKSIIWTTAGSLWIGHSEKISVIFESKYEIPTRKNKFENGVYKMAAILSRSERVRNKWLGMYYCIFWSNTYSYSYISNKRDVSKDILVTLVHLCLD